MCNEGKCFPKVWSYCISCCQSRRINITLNYCVKCYPSLITDYNTLQRNSILTIKPFSAISLPGVLMHRSREVQSKDLPSTSLLFTYSNLCSHARFYFLINHLWLSLLINRHGKVQNYIEIKLEKHAIHITRNVHPRE